MAGKPYQPKGFCPHCGYRMDAGACPECGREINQDQLAMRPPRWWRRRRVRVLVLCLVVFAVGLREAYKRDLHIKFLPDSLLIGMDVPRPKWVTAELVRRLKSDELTLAEEAALLASVLTTSLQIQSPYPANVSLPVDAVLELGLPSCGALYLREPKVTVDGRPESIAEDGGGVHLSPLGNGERVTTRVIILGLQPGRHVISLSGDVLLRPNQWRGVDRPQLTFHATQEVFIEDVRAEDFAKPLYHQALAEDIRMAASVWVSGGVRGDELAHYFKLSFDHSPVTVYFDLYLRLSGSGEYQMHDSYMFGSTAGPSAVSFSWGDLFPDAGETGFMDVKLVPNAKAALHNGLTEYFNGVLEWHGVPFRPEESFFHPDHEFNPTVVRALADCEK